MKFSNFNSNDKIKKLIIARIVCFLVAIILFLIALIGDLPLKSYESKKIDFTEYKSNLEVDTYCYIDLRLAIPIADYGISYNYTYPLGASDRFYCAVDKNGDFVVVVTEYMTAFEEKIEQIDGSIRFYGKIADVDIKDAQYMPDVEGIVKEYYETGVMPNSLYDTGENLKEFLSQKTIMRIIIDMPKEEKIPSGIGSGAILCIIAIVLLMLRCIIKGLLKSAIRENSNSSI